MEKWVGGGEDITALLKLESYLTFCQCRKLMALTHIMTEDANDFTLRQRRISTEIG